MKTPARVLDKQGRQLGNFVVLGLLLFVWGCGDGSVSDQPDAGGPPDAAPAPPDAAPAPDVAPPPPPPGDPPVWVDGVDGLDSTVPWLKITAVDVGQGDGLVLGLPSGKVMALDGGPADKDNAYQKFLDAEGYKTLDYMLLTHAHSDHYTGLNAVVNRLPDDCEPRAMDPGYFRMDVVGYKTWRTAVGCHYQALAIDQTVMLDPLVDIQVLGAADMPYPGNDNSGVNNTSVMLHLRYGRFTALLSGDSESEAEAKVLQRAESSLPSTVLKAGHHGSCTASATSFLRAVNPAYVLISAGAGNTYGLPNCQTMAKLKTSSAHWYRTDTNGDLRVVSDGTRYTIVVSRGDRDDDSCPRDCANYNDF
jgi:competence protein ComEC